MAKIAGEAKEHQAEKQSKTATSSNWSKILRAKMKTHHSDQTLGQVFRRLGDFSS